MILLTGYLLIISSIGTMMSLVLGFHPQLWSIAELVTLNVVSFIGGGAMVSFGTIAKSLQASKFNVYGWVAFAATCIAEALVFNAKL